MSVCTFYEVISDDLLSQIAGDAGLIEVLEQIWCIVGIYNVFNELDAEEVEEITEDLPGKSVKQLRKMLNAAASFTYASTEGSYDLHKVGFTNALTELGVDQAETIFKLLFNGEKQWLPDSYSFQIVSSQTCAKLADILNQIQPTEAIKHYDFSQYDSPEHWTEDIQAELSDLIECYKQAARHNASVLIGSG